MPWAGPLRQALSFHAEHECHQAPRLTGLSIDGYGMEEGMIKQIYSQLETTHDPRRLTLGQTGDIKQGGIDDW